MRLVVTELNCVAYVEATSSFSCSQLKERSAQLTLDLAHANEAVLVVASERDTLRTVVQEHEAEEERLQVQLRERDKIMSDMKQRQNAEIK